MDWPLLAVVTLSAILGGYLGERIMQERLEPAHVKKPIAILLLAMAAKRMSGFI